MWVGIGAGIVGGMTVASTAWVHFQIWLILSLVLPVGLCIAGARQTRTLVIAAFSLSATMQGWLVLSRVHQRYYSAYGLRWEDVRESVFIWGITLGLALVVGYAANRWQSSKTAS